MSRRLDIDLTFNLPQWRAYRRLAKRGRIFLPWGRGVGKTAFIRFVMLMLVAEYDGKWRTAGIKRQRGIRIVVLLPTLKQFKDLYWADFETDLLPGGQFAFLGAKLDKGRGHITFPGGSWIKPFPAAQSTGKRARGMRADVLVGDEIDDIDAGVYDGVGIPLLSDPVSLGIELIGGTPTRGRHGLWYRLLETCRLSDKLRDGKISTEDAMRLDVAKATLEVFQQLPAEDWPEGYSTDPVEATIQVLSSYYGRRATYRDAPETVSALAVAKAKADLSPATFAREYEADPNAGEGLVFPFKDEFHVREPPAWKTFREIHVGMDHGYSPDPGAMLLIGIRGSGDAREVWLLDEHYETKVDNDEWNRRARAWNFQGLRNSVTYWVDRSRGDRIAELRSLGLDVRESDSNPGSIEAGVSQMVNLMTIRLFETGKWPLTQVERYSRFYVSPICVNAIKEIGKYRYPKLPDGSFGTKPVGKDDHLIDCARMTVLGLFGRPSSGKQVVGGR